MDTMDEGAMTALKAARLAKGWKAARLARELGVSETTLSRWENDHPQQPRRRHQVKLCRILGKDPTDLGFAEDLLDPDRREFTTRILAALGTAAVAPLVASAGGESLQRLAAAARKPSRVGIVAVEHLEVVTQTHRDLYHELNAVELITAVTGHLQVTTLLLGGTQRLPLRRRLAAMAAETAGHAAWLCHDLGDQPSAEQYYALAEIATRDAGNPALTAYVRGFQSLVTASQGQASKALVLARGAVEKAARSATATTKAWLACLEAQALVVVGDRKGCFAALRRAETALGQARRDQDPAWMYDFDHPRLLAFAGACYGQLGKAPAAERTLREALNALGPHRSRRRAEVLLDLARARAQQHDVHDAADLAEESLQIALETGSTAGIQRVARFRPELARWNGTRHVTTLDDQLADVL